MKKNLHITFDLSIFANVPRVTNHPTLHITALQHETKTVNSTVFNRVLYKLIDGKIRAFKVLAWALAHETNSCGLERAYLVQFPNESPRWIRRFADDNKVATSVENLVNGRFIDLCRHGFDYEFGLRDFQESHVYSDYVFRRSYEIINGVVHTRNSVISYVMCTEDGLFIGLSHPNGNCVQTREQAIADFYDGMEVIDFAEPIKVEIEVQPTSAVKGILRFE